MQLLQKPVLTRWNKLGKILLDTLARPSIRSWKRHLYRRVVIEITKENLTTEYTGIFTCTRTLDSMLLALKFR